MSPLRWTCKSLRQAGRRAEASGPLRVARTSWASCCSKLGYSLQANRKTREGSTIPTATPSFEHINHQVKEHMAARSRSISVDTKKKELVGDFKNGGRELRPKGTPREGAGARLRRSRAWARRPLRGLRHRDNDGLGQRGHRSRHGRVRGRHHPALVAARWGARAIRTPAGC